MYKLKEANIDKAVLQYGEEIENKPFGQAIKNEISPYYIVYADNRRITNFIVYKNDDNWLALDREVINHNELMNFVLEKLKPNYSYLTIFLEEKDKKLINQAENDYNFKKTNEKRLNYIKMRKDFKKIFLF